MNISSAFPRPFTACAALSLLFAATCCDPRETNAVAAPGSDGPGTARSDIGRDRVVLDPAALASHGIRVEVATPRDLLATFLVPAHVTYDPEAMAHVGSPVRGRVSAVRAKLGDVVGQGDPLLVIESPELGEAQSAYLQRRSAAQAAVPSVELAVVSHSQAKALYDESQGISLVEVQRRESELRNLQATLDAARSAADAARNALLLLGMTAAAIDHLASSGDIAPQFTVPAPIAGQVIARDATLGELVGPDREALVVLADVRKPWILAAVPEARLRDVSVGAPARVLVGADNSHWCSGKVAFIAPDLDPATRSVQVRIEVEDQHPELRPGVFAQVEITALQQSVRGVLAVPSHAIQTVDGHPVLFVPVPGTSAAFAPRAVQIDPPVAGLVPVRSGLEAGEAYVAEGSFILRAELEKHEIGHDH